VKMMSICVVLLAALPGCLVDSGTIVLEGTYTGTFTIFDGDNWEQSGGVTFEFTEDRYTCTPSVQYLPPAGSGTYVFKLDSIVLKDTAMHSAEFDWTLILNGAFHMSKSGDRISLSQYDRVHKRQRFIELSRVSR
jgi:hypothetical protein